MTTGKTIALTRWTFVGKLMSLFFNMLSRLVITLLPKRKHLLISWLHSALAVILDPPQIKVCHCFQCFPIYFPWSDGIRCHDLSFLNVELWEGTVGLIKTKPSQLWLKVLVILELLYSTCLPLIPTKLLTRYGNLESDSTVNPIRCNLPASPLCLTPAFQTSCRYRSLGRT